MKKKILIGMVATLLLAFSASLAFADETDLDGDYLWNYHAAPFDFRFNNMIDSHQQSFVTGNGQKLQGFIYIHDIGEDYSEGIPTAEKAHCPTGSCMVGWVVKGVRIEAKLVNKGPRIWLVDENDIPKEVGYSHFHWLGLPKSPHDLEVGTVYEGFLMKRIAPAPFFWLGGSGKGGGGGGGGCGGGTHDDGGCTDGTHDDGGCTDGTHDDGGCTDGTHDDGGCSDGGDAGSHGGSSGRLVQEGVDSHSNIITSLDQLGHGGCHDN